ncbi:TPA: hypothetical protein ACF9Z3_002287 [Legionella pneumophila]
MDTLSSIVRAEEALMPSRSLVWNLMFRAKASRRCLRISSAPTNPGYRQLLI